MAHISSLHDLARSGLHELASKRVMPSGYERALSRRTDVMANQLPAMLTVALADVADSLMARPTHARWVELLNVATQERLLQGMVSRWVALLDAEPKPDQQTACALATTLEQIAGASRLMSRLEALSKELNEAQSIITLCRFEGDLDLYDTREAVADVLTHARALQKRLDCYEESLTEDITP